MMKRPPLHLFLSSAFAAAVVGCAGPLDHDSAPAVDAQTLRQIDAVELKEQSRTPPASVEDATAKALQRLSEVGPTPPPAPSIDLDLSEVRAAALANNLDLKIELVNPSIAAESVAEEEAKFESTFTASARRSVTDSPVAVATEGSSVVINQFNFGVNVPLRTGGTINVDLPFSEVDTNNPFSLLNPSYQADLNFSIAQPLLRGAWDESTMHSIRVARLQATATDARTKLEAIRILANADRAYWRLYAARRQFEVAQKQYELAMTQLDHARRRVQAGDAAEIEVTRAESGVAERLEAIIITFTAVRRAQRDLKRIIDREDLPMDGPTMLITTTEPSPLGLDLDPGVLAERAVANRMEMLELELQLAIDASTINFQRNAALPLVTVDYTYSIGGLGSSYGRAFDQIADRSFEDHFFGMRAEIPIGNEAAKARVNQAILARLQRLATKEQRRAAIQQEVFDALDQLNQSWQSILAARQASILAGRTYEAEQRQFDVGLRTSTDVLDAAARLADAQFREIQALADYQIAQVDIAFATGTLLGHGRVQWTPTTLNESH